MGNENAAVLPVPVLRARRESSRLERGEAGRNQPLLCHDGSRRLGRAAENRQLCQRNSNSFRGFTRRWTCTQRCTHRKFQTHTTEIGLDYEKRGALFELAGILLCAADHQKGGLWN